MSERTPARPAAAGRTLLRSTLLIAAVFGVGVSGYLAIGEAPTPFVDAVYMTVITLTTVGYGEVIDLSANPAGRWFTIALLLVGTGSFLYFFSNLTAFIVEGGLDRFLRQRRMRNAIEGLSNHTIVCGAGDTGRHIVRELIDTHRPFVVIDADEDRLTRLESALGCEFPAVLGDATDDDVLMAAGIERAEGLAACIAADKDNLIVTVSARMLNPKLRIVCRCIDEKVTAKIRQAGADAVVSPNQIGGLRIVSELVRPDVVSFLDIMLRDRSKGLRVEEHRIESDSALANATMASVRAKKLDALLIVALREPSGEWRFNPPDEARLPVGGHLIYMGNPDARAQLETLARGAAVGPG